MNTPTPGLCYTGVIIIFFNDLVSSEERCATFNSARPNLSKPDLHYSSIFRLLVSKGFSFIAKHKKSFLHLRFEVRLFFQSFYLDSKKYSCKSTKLFNCNLSGKSHHSFLKLQLSIGHIILLCRPHTAHPCIIQFITLVIILMNLKSTFLQLQLKKEWEDMGHMKPNILEKDYERALQKTATRLVFLIII